MVIQPSIPFVHSPATTIISLFEIDAAKKFSSSWKLSYPDHMQSVGAQTSMKKILQSFTFKTRVVSFIEFHMIRADRSLSHTTIILPPLYE